MAATLHNSNLLNPNTFLTNDSYFIWGHNGAALSCSDMDAGLTNSGDFILERLDREWKGTGNWNSRCNHIGI